MSDQGKIKQGKREMNWPWVLWCIHLHFLGVYGIYQLLMICMWPTFIYAITLTIIGSFGLTIGAHRLWAHQTFEAHWIVKLILMLAQTSTGSGSIHDWVLAHRIHHKYHGTDNDPYDHRKGFFYSHIISNLYEKPENYAEMAKLIDMRDIENDTIIWIQKKFYLVLFFIFGILLPINAPAEYWGEMIFTSFCVIGFLRAAISLHISWLIHSAINIWNLKPEEKYPPDDNLIFFVNRTYWISYHYLLPWDWKTGEFGSYNGGMATTFIKFLEAMGVVDNMKTASSESIREALHTLATKKTVNEVLDDVKKAAEYEAAKSKFYFHH